MLDKKLIEQPYLPSLDEQVYSIAETTMLLEALREEGVDVANVLLGTGLGESALTDPAALVSIRQRLMVYQNAQRFSQNPALGLHVGERLQISSYGIWGYALLSCPSLLGAIEFAFEYMKLAGPVVKKSFLVEDDVAIFRGEDVLDLGCLKRFSMELWFSAALQWGRDILRGSFSLQEMRFTHPEPDYSDEYYRIFDCPIYFDCACDEMRFSTTYLETPTERANPLTEQMCRELCDRMLLKLQAKNGVVKDVQSMLLATPGHIPDIESIADKLCMTTRTLRRKLGSHGTSYQHLVNETRKQLAISYLRDTHMSVEEIASRVGFSEAASFRAAFKRWTDKTPSMYRSATT